MATPNYDINYDDDRFKTVEAQKQTALNQMNNTYNNMINQSDKYYQAQIDATNNYAETQKQLQQANTDFAIEKINQQKDQAQKDYIKEQTGAYVDWQKQSNQYGANAEQMASSGLTNTGYSESSQVSMYNTYQNRVSNARDSYNRAVLNYDNSIKEARLANNSALAEIAFNALQTQLELSLQGFQYKNTLLETQLNQQRDIDKDYYSRWQNVLSQMNTENQLKENIRQYEENLAYQKEQDRIKMEYQKERDRIADEQWQKEYNLSLASRYSSGGGGGSSSSGGSSGNGTITTAYYSGKMPSATSQAASSYGTFSNGYQPKGIVGYGALSSTGKTKDVVSTTLQGTTTHTTQTIWKTPDGTKWIWNGMSMKYDKYKG